MPGDQYLVDTNVLIRWVRREAPEYALIDNSVKKLAQLGQVPCYTSQILGEFWNVLTRPADRNGYGLSPVEANCCAIDVETSLYILRDNFEVHREWRRLLVDFNVSGAQVHDARLVAAMPVHGGQRILTFKTKDFARYPGVEAVHPARAA